MLKIPLGQIKSPQISTFYASHYSFDDSTGPKYTPNDFVKTAYDRENQKFSKTIKVMEEFKKL